MLGIFSNKSDHPLANVKSAQQLLDGLPKSDSVELLQEIGHWIEVLFDPSNGFRLDYQFNVLRMLDEAAHPHLRKITYSYFAAVPPSDFQENRQWQSLNAYSTFSDLGYLDLVIGLKNGEKGSSSIKPSIALICARGIYAVFDRLECAAVKYAQIEPQLWAQLAEFYNYAEAHQCLDEELSPYVGTGASTSVRRLFASVLMWYSAGVGSFTPLDLHIVKRLIIYMNKAFSLEDSCQPDSQFVFDLAQSSPPAKVKEGGAMYPESVRFMGVGAAPALLENLLKTLGKDLLPVDLNMGVVYSAEVVNAVAAQLSECCKQQSPARRNPRRKIKVHMNVVLGFSSLVEQTEATVHFDRTPAERWEVEDISANGLSGILPAGQSSTVKIGALIGLQPEKIEHWGVGVVRRMSRDAGNNLHVGVEMLASKLMGVTLSAFEGGDTDADHPALLLEKNDAPNGESWVLVQSDTFSINRSPIMRSDHQQFLLLPIALVEKGADFDLARYRKMEQESSGDEDY
jgi:hypothetical protein